MNNTPSATTPERIMQLAWAFAPPLVIEAAVRHLVFDVLANQPLTLEALAQATGAILTVKSLYELKRTGGRYALVTMCIGGGQGIAAIFERV